ncbi:MAG: hypothetical protein ACRDO2_13375 [Nocardioidaceae bacterium]
MASPIHTQGATTMCLHGGQAQPTVPLPRVTVSGQKAIGQATTYTISGCPFVVGTAPSPCVTASWVVAATRVQSTGIPLVLANSTAVCVPNGTGLTLVPGQVRVTAT